MRSETEDVAESDSATLDGSSRREHLPLLEDFHHLVDDVGVVGIATQLNGDGAADVGDGGSRRNANDARPEVGNILVVDLKTQQDEQTEEQN